MNKHINKKRREVVVQHFDADGLVTKETVIEPAALSRKADPNTRMVLGMDKMPEEVATSMLLELEKMTNRVRKNCMLAREVAYESIREGKSAEQRTAARLKKATWAQVLKWHKRAISREGDVQRTLQSLQRAIDKVPAGEKHERRRKLLTRSYNAYMLKGGALQEGIHCLESEMDRRTDFLAGLKKVAPTVAIGIMQEMVNKS